MNFRIKIIDKYGRDVTKNNDWYIDTDGTLCFETDDIDMPIQAADKDFRYEIIVSN